MNLPSCSALAALACVAVLAGCASPREHATFVTKTSFSLVDVDTAPAGVSIAYDRVEGYIGPRFDDGTVFPVAGSLETNGEFMNRQIRQVYATGNAALLVTAKTLPAESNASEATTTSGATPVDTSAAGVAGGATPQATPVATPPDNKVMFFGTGTSVGLKLGFTGSTPVPTSFALGYKRKELSVIPVEKGAQWQPSVLASFDNTAGTRPAPVAGAREGVAFDIEQFFATGQAADNLAKNDGIRTRFQDKAKRAIGPVEEFRLREGQQGRMALDTLSCFTDVPDDKIERVFNNAEDLVVLKPDVVARMKRVAGARAQRDDYVRQLSLLNAGSPEHTVALGMHQKVVCNLAGKP